MLCLLIHNVQFIFVYLFIGRQKRDFTLRENAGNYGRFSNT